MGALPRPDLTPGPHRDLVDALHDLHHRAGWPSLRTLAREVGVSHTTVSHAFSSTRLPTWGIVEVLVEAMHGDVTAFHDLWLAASAPATNDTGPTPRIAGRRPELAAVRRHMEAGSGLLLVTGEAGIGKTMLVRAVISSATCFVASGHCLPLSIQDPLMPVIDAMRAVHAHDDGQALKEALSDLHPFFRDALARLLPELGDGAAVAGFDDTVRQHVFAAVGRCLSLLHDQRGLGIVFEDLHWADAATLDLVEYLVTGETSLPLVGTWRTDDPTVSQKHSDWLLRMQRLTGASTTGLAPLTLAETTEQLSLGSGALVDPTLAIRIHDRSQGHPLYTEQLATQVDHPERPLPRHLSELLDRRLEGLPRDAIAVSTALGVADRDLSAALLGEATGLDQERLVVALHELAGRHLLATGDSPSARLRHPLLAEAARRRLVPGEAARTHHRLARALAAQPEPNAAEVAEHWKEAGDAELELQWRAAAARQAHARTDPRAESVQWLRVLELAAIGTANDFDLVASRIEAFDALELAGQLEAAAPLIREALIMVDDLDDVMAAEILRRAAIAEGLIYNDVPAALALTERAIDRLEPHGPSQNLVHVLDQRANDQIDVGQFDEATSSLKRALDVCATLDDPGLYFRTSATLAWHLAHMGDLDAALERIRIARDRQPAPAGPRLEAYMGMVHTDALIQHRRPAEEVIAAAEPALAIGRELEMDFHYMTLVRGNVAESLFRAGHVSQAADIVAAMPVSDSYNHWPVRWMSALLAIPEGRPEEAIHTLTNLTSTGSSPQNWLNRAEWMAVAELWLSRPEDAWSRLVSALEDVLRSPAIVDYGQSFVTAARAAADLARCGDTGHDAARLKVDLEQLRERAVIDPLGPAGAPIIRPATTAQWHAELGRIEGRDTPEQWSRAATSWDALRSPHEAAYCRWRGAQVAIASGQGALATKLLRRASHDAQEHVPLLGEIRRLAGQ